MSESTPYFTPAQPAATPPPEAEVAADLAARQAAAPGGITGVDADALLQAMAAMQARLDSLEAERAAGAAVPVQATADALRDLISTHAAHYPGADHGDVLRLADDVVAAAANAVNTGDGSQLHVLAQRLGRALAKVDPGAGDHHWYRQAVGFATVHLPDAADQLVPKRGAVSDAPPAGAISGSVVG